MDETATQLKRRRLFYSLLAALFLPVLVVALLPGAQAEEPVVVATADAVTDSAPSTTSTSAPATTDAPTSETATTVAPTTAAPPTTVKPKATTTTTAKPKVIVQAAAAAPTTATPAPPAVAPTEGASASEASFLACVRERESHGNYGVVSSNGMYFGAYQFSRSTWDAVANHAGRPDLVGVAPNQASPSDQDAMALAELRWQGKAPWGGVC